MLTSIPDTNEWLQPGIKGDLPCARGQHSAVQAGDKLVLFGGSSEFSLELMVCQKFHGDVFIADVGKYKYSPFLHYPLVPSFRKINIGKTGNQNPPDL